MKHQKFPYIFLLKKLTKLAQKAEENFIPNDNFEAVLQKEKDDAWKYGGRTSE